MQPRPRLLLLIAWACVCGGAFLLWQGPTISPPSSLGPKVRPAGVRGPRTHISNTRYLQDTRSPLATSGSQPRHAGPPNADDTLDEADAAGGLDEDEEVPASVGYDNFLRARNKAFVKYDQDEHEDGEEEYEQEQEEPEQEEEQKEQEQEEIQISNEYQEEDEEKDDEASTDDEEQDEEGIGDVGGVEDMRMAEDVGMIEDVSMVEDVGMAEDVGGAWANQNATPDATLLVYNRIPKCASSTMQTILRRLSRHLGYEHISSLVYNQHRLSTSDQHNLVSQLMESVSAAPDAVLSYDRHLYYTNFTQFGGASPVYVNVVRDPVERFISSFYYKRSQERLNRIQVNGKNTAPSPGWLNRTVEQCVEARDNECRFDPGDEKEMILTYFCGHEDFCRVVGHPDAVQVAKEVVSREYSVVGLVEDMELSLSLMQVLVPRFMHGALDVYRSIREKEHKVVNMNVEKPKVSRVVQELLKRQMADDYDFYYFLQQRLYMQQKAFLPARD